jgi:hypothetical protein
MKDLTPLGRALDEIDTLRRQLEEIAHDKQSADDARDIYKVNALRVRDERNALRRQLEVAKGFHPRAMKLIEKQKNFLVVAIDEPYFRQVYDLIRDNEMNKGTWTIEDENHYIDALAEIKGISGDMTNKVGGGAE